MIKSFRHKGLKQFYETRSLAGIQPKHATRLRLQLGALDRAATPEKMNVPGWKWHALNRDLEGHWAVFVNGNWRLTFTSEGQNAILVDYQDYH